MSDRPIRRALLSVWDKTGLIDFARALTELGVTLISTGGTASALRDGGLEVTDVSALTGTPGILDGRVKTLHPAVHGGILARRDLDGHMATLEALDMAPIDLVVVNLYPFEATIAEGTDPASAIEMIDIGGVALIRAGAKNHTAVTVVTDPAEFGPVLDQLRGGDGRTSAALRQRLAADAFARTAAYDAAIAGWFARQTDDLLPARLTIGARRRQATRYGENPHQRAAFYAMLPDRPGVAGAEQVQGKALSYNNIADADAAFELATELAEPAAVIVKHANPAGAAIGASVAEAYAKALACDPLSAYGGIVALNRPLDGPCAERVAEIFTEVVIAPDADAEARAILGRKANLRLLLTGGVEAARPGELVVRSVVGGLLVQERDRHLPDPGAMGRVVTERAPSPAELADLAFAFTICKHVRSNAIVFARNGATVGIGAGQMSRVDAVRIAVSKAVEAAEASAEAEPRTRGSVIASDAFFPFPDGLEAGLDAGATAVIQPGGSMRDEAVIGTADAAGAAMLFTGVRHFRH